MNVDFQVILPAITALFGSVITYFIARGDTTKDITINDRQQLSEDEKVFRAELRETIIDYKKELELARVEIGELRKEVAGLHQINLKLTLENRQLQIKVDELRAEVQTFRSESNN